MKNDEQKDIVNNAHKATSNRFRNTILFGSLIPLLICFIVYQVFKSSQGELIAIILGVVSQIIASAAAIFIIKHTSPGAKLLRLRRKQYEDSRKRFIPIDNYFKD